MIKCLLPLLSPKENGAGAPAAGGLITALRAAGAPSPEIAYFVLASATETALKVTLLPLEIAGLVKSLV